METIMFRRMRNRILLVNMTIITALISILLGVIYLTTYNRIQADDQAELEHISRWDFFGSATAAGEAVATGDFTLSVTPAVPRLYLPFAGTAVKRAGWSTVAGELWTGSDAIKISSFQAVPFTSVSYFTAASGQGVHAAVSAERTGPSMIRLAPTDLSHSFHVIVDEDGAVVRINSYTGLTEEECSQAAAEVWRAGRDGGTFKAAGRTLMYTVQPLNPRYLVYEISDSAIFTRLEPSSHRITFLDVTASRNTLRQLLTTELAAAAVGLVFIFLISFFFANRSIAPIARSWEQQKQFVADASHELKTPLAVIGANSDALLASPDETVDSQRIWIEYIQAETVRMGKLVSSLLELAHTESLTAAEPAPLNLSELVTDAVLTMEAVAFERGLSLNSALAPNLHITACREDVQRILLILLDNATKYTDSGGTISVTLTQEKRQALLTVHNSGEGLSEDALARMFDRFFRADPARSRDAGSFGLGLSIAKNLVHQTGGTITAASRPGDGVTLTVVLPLI